MMRSGFIFGLLLFSTLNLFGQSNKDRQAIQKQIQAFIDNWNVHNYSTMKTYTTEDVDWVNIVGMWWKGRRNVQYAHQSFHQAMFKNVTLELKSSAIRFVTKDVAIAHIRTHYGEFTTPGGNKMGNSDDLATLVFVKKKGTWLLTAGENVTVNEAAQRHDPVKEMDKK
jgi:uncharacterized protein (TIGR02246 family)